MELGALGEFIGSFGVIATLVYLALQIRANTRTARAEASFNALHSWAQLNENFCTQPEEFHELMLRATAPGARAEGFTDTEWHRVSQAFRAVMQKLEGQLYLYKYGLMEPNIWEKRSRVAAGLIDSPLMQAWWDNEQLILSFSDEFVAAVESADSMGVPGSAIFRKLPTTE
jgi:hypothetical protein